MQIEKQTFLTNIATTIISGITIALVIAGIRALKKNNDAQIRIETKIEYLQHEIENKR